MTKIFIEYEPIETAWVSISGKNYEYIYCLWVAGSFKGKGIAKELLEYAINDSKEKGMSGICTLTSKKKKPFVGEKKFFEKNSCFSQKTMLLYQMRLRNDPPWRKR